MGVEVVLEISYLYEKGYSKRKIANTLGISIEQVNKHIRENYDQIYKLYVDGKTCNQIANTLNKNISTVNSHINRNLKEFKFIHIENRIMKIKELYEEGYIAREIAEKLDERVDTIRYQIYKNFNESKNTHKLNRIKNRPGDEIKNLYVKGYNISEISKILELDKNNVKMHVSRNLGPFKVQHEKSRKENEEIKKVVSKMSKSFISDQSLLKINRQSYNYNKNYDLVFNESRGERPFDLPKRYKNNEY